MLWQLQFVIITLIRYNLRYDLFFRWRVSHIDDTYVVINVSGVGYMVHCLTPYLSQLKKMILRSYLFIIIFAKITNSYLVFNRILNEMYLKRYCLFQVLARKLHLNSSNVGLQDFIQAIQTDNIMFITQCPGIGKKTAERMILELKDKLSPYIIDLSPSAVDKNIPIVAPSNNDSEDLLLALRQLGYQKDEIKRVFIKHATEIAGESSIENQIKVVLKHL